MAAKFNITAELILRGPRNLRPIVADIKRQISGIDANINLKLNKGAARQLSQINNQVANFNKSSKKMVGATANVSSNLAGLSSASSSTAKNLKSVGSAAASQSKSMKQAADATKSATTAMVSFGQQSQLAIKRFLAFAIPTGVLIKFSTAVQQATTEAIEFERELIKISQVTGKSIQQLSGLSSEITRLSTTFGVAASELVNISRILAQTGMSAKDTKTALEALAKSSLAPTFKDMENTAEGAIAAMAVFGVSVDKLEQKLGSINAVAGKFAVESEDIIFALRRTGAAFKAAGGSMEELIGLFTSVRATTRESSETIATGLRTIFTRIRRPRTIQFLKQLGIELQNTEGQFIGPMQAIGKLNSALGGLATTDPKFGQVVEELGGYRQVSKVIPLLKEFGKAQAAIAVAQAGSASLTIDAAKAQETLAVKLANVKNEFSALFRELTDSSTFKNFADVSISLANAFINIGKSLKPVLPMLAAVASLKIAGAVTQFGAGFLGAARAGGGVRAAGGAIGGAVTGKGGQNNQKLITALNLSQKALHANTQSLGKLNASVLRLVGSVDRLAARPVKAFARGGVVPGTGNSDSVPAVLTPGEFVIRKSAVKAMGTERLHSMNKMAKGGPGIMGGPQNFPDTKRGEDQRKAFQNLQQGIQGPQPTVLQLGNKSNQFGGFFMQPVPADDREVITRSTSKETVGKLKNWAISKPNLFGGGKGSPVDYSKLREIRMPLSLGYMEQDSKERFENRARSLYRNAIKEVVEKHSGGPKGKKTLAQKAGGLNVTDAQYKQIAKKSNEDGVVGGIFEGFVSALSSNFTKAKNDEDFDFSGSLMANSLDVFNHLFGSGGNLYAADTKRSFVDASDFVKKAINLVTERGTVSPTKHPQHKHLVNTTEFLIRGTEGGPGKIKDPTTVGEEFATGGGVYGKDSVPAMLTPGEFVVNKRAAARLGSSTLNRMNRVQALNKGGWVQNFTNGGGVDGLKPGGGGPSLAQAIGDAGFGLMDPKEAITEFARTAKEASVAMKAYKDAVEKGATQAEALSKAEKSVSTLRKKRLHKQKKDAAPIAAETKARLQEKHGGPDPKTQKAFAELGSTTTFAVMGLAGLAAQIPRVESEFMSIQNVAGNFGTRMAANVLLFQTLAPVMNTARGSLGKLSKSTKLSVTAQNIDTGITARHTGSVVRDGAALDAHAAKASKAATKTTMLALGAAAVGATMSAFGDEMQRTAQKQIDSATDHATASAAASKKTAGAALSAAGQFGATGASMGAAFGPWGVAIGAAAGALIGLATAASKAAEEQEKAAAKVRENKFAKSQELFTSIMADIDAKRLTLASKRAAIEEQLLNQVKNRRGAATGKEREKFEKDMRGNLDQVFKLADKTAEGFSKGGKGVEAFLKEISLLRTYIKEARPDLSSDEVDTLFEDIFNNQKNAAEAATNMAKAAFEMAKRQKQFAALGTAVERAAKQAEHAAQVLGNIESIFAGEIGEPQITGPVEFGDFEDLSNVTDLNDFNKAVKQVTDPLRVLGKVGKGTGLDKLLTDMERDIGAAAAASSKLPSVLLEAKRSAEASGQGLATELSKALENAGIGGTIASVIKGNLGSRLAKSPTELGKIMEEIGNNSVAAAEELSKGVSENLGKALKQAGEALVGETNRMLKSFATAAQMQQQIQDKVIDMIKGRFDQEKYIAEITGSAFDDRAALEKQRADTQNALGIGSGGPFRKNISQLGRELRKAANAAAAQRQTLEQDTLSGNIKKTSGNMVDMNAKVSNLIRGLKQMDEINKKHIEVIKQEIDERNRSKAAISKFVTDFVFSTDKQRMSMVKAMMATRVATAASRGQVAGADPNNPLGTFSDEDRNMLGQFLSGPMAKARSKVFGDLTKGDQKVLGRLGVTGPWSKTGASKEDKIATGEERKLILAFKTLVHNLMGSLGLSEKDAKKQATELLKAQIAGTDPLLKELKAAFKRGDKIGETLVTHMKNERTIFLEMLSNTHAIFLQNLQKNLLQADQTDKQLEKAQVDEEASRLGKAKGKAIDLSDTLEVSEQKVLEMSGIAEANREDIDKLQKVRGSLKEDGEREELKSHSRGELDKALGIQYAGFNDGWLGKGEGALFEQEGREFGMRTFRDMSGVTRGRMRQANEADAKRIEGFKEGGKFDKNKFETFLNNIKLEGINWAGALNAEEKGQLRVQFRKAAEEMEKKTGVRVPDTEIDNQITRLIKSVDELASVNRVKKGEELIMPHSAGRRYMGGSTRAVMGNALPRESVEELVRQEMFSLLTQGTERTAKKKTNDLKEEQEVIERRLKDAFDVNNQGLTNIITAIDDLQTLGATLSEFNIDPTVSTSFGELTKKLDTATERSSVLGGSLEFLTKKIDGINTKIKEINKQHFARMSALPGYKEPLPRRAKGGWASGKPAGKMSRGSDTMLSLLTPGEFVVNKESASQHQGLLESINKGDLDEYASGGVVGRKPKAGASFLSGGRGAPKLASVEPEVRDKKLIEVLSKIDSNTSGTTKILTTYGFGDLQLRSLALLKDIRREISILNSNISPLLTALIPITAGGFSVESIQAGGVSQLAKGGSIFQPKGTDTVPAMLTPGEFVVKKSSVNKYGSGMLNAINKGYYAEGGEVSYLKKGGLFSRMKDRRSARSKISQKEKALSDKVDNENLFSDSDEWKNIIFGTRSPFTRPDAYEDASKMASSERSLQMGRLYNWAKSGDQRLGESEKVLKWLEMQGYTGGRTRSAQIKSRGGSGAFFSSQDRNAWKKGRRYAMGGLVEYLQGGGDVQANRRRLQDEHNAYIKTLEDGKFFRDGLPILPPNIPVSARVHNDLWVPSKIGDKFYDHRQNLKNESLNDYNKRMDEVYLGSYQHQAQYDEKENRNSFYKWLFTSRGPEPTIGADPGKSLGINQREPKRVRDSEGNLIPLTPSQELEGRGHMDYSRGRPERIYLDHVPFNPETRSTSFGTTTLSDGHIRWAIGHSGALDTERKMRVGYLNQDNWRAMLYKPAELETETMSHWPDYLDAAPPNADAYYKGLQRRHPWQRLAEWHSTALKGVGFGVKGPILPEEYWQKDAQGKIIGYSTGRTAPERGPDGSAYGGQFRPRHPGGVPTQSSPQSPRAKQADSAVATSEKWVKDSFEKHGNDADFNKPGGIAESTNFRKAKSHNDAIRAYIEILNSISEQQTKPPFEGGPIKDFRKLWGKEHPSYTGPDGLHRAVMLLGRSSFRQQAKDAFDVYMGMTGVGLPHEEDPYGRFAWAKKRYNEERVAIPKRHQKGVHGKKFYEIMAKHGQDGPLKNRFSFEVAKRLVAQGFKDTPTLSYDNARHAYWNNIIEFIDDLDKREQEGHTSFKDNRPVAKPGGDGKVSQGYATHKKAFENISRFEEDKKSLHKLGYSQYVLRQHEEKLSKKQASEVLLNWDDLKKKQQDEDLPEVIMSDRYKKELAKSKEMHDKKGRTGGTMIEGTTFRWGNGKGTLEYGFGGDRWSALKFIRRQRYGIWTDFSQKVEDPLDPSKSFVVHRNKLFGGGDAENYWGAIQSYKTQQQKDEARTKSFNRGGQTIIDASAPGMVQGITGAGPQDAPHQLTLAGLKAIVEKKKMLESDQMLDGSLLGLEPAAGSIPLAIGQLNRGTGYQSYHKDLMDWIADGKSLTFRQRGQKESEQRANDKIRSSLTQTWESGQYKAYGTAVGFRHRAPLERVPEGEGAGENLIKFALDEPTRKVDVPMSLLTSPSQRNILQNAIANGMLPGFAAGGMVNPFRKGAGWYTKKGRAARRNAYLMGKNRKAASWIRGRNPMMSTVGGRGAMNTRTNLFDALATMPGQDNTSLGGGSWYKRSDSIRTAGGGDNAYYMEYFLGKHIPTHSPIKNQKIEKNLRESYSRLQETGLFAGTDIDDLPVKSNATMILRLLEKGPKGNKDYIAMRLAYKRVMNAPPGVNPPSNKGEPDPYDTSTLGRPNSSLNYFNTGGSVPGSGSRDTVPAMLTPGEYVLRKSAVDNIGVGALNRMNYHDGGQVGRNASSIRDERVAATPSGGAGISGEAISAINRLTGVLSTNFSNGINLLGNSMNGFSGSVDIFKKAVEAIPDTINFNHTGKHDINVDLNGLEVLTRIDSTVRTIVGEAIDERLEEYDKELRKGTNPGAGATRGSRGILGGK